MLRSTLRLLYDAAQTWIDDRAIRLGAGVAYYGLFALIPVLFLAISFASLFLGQEAVREEVGKVLVDLFGSDASAAIIQAVSELLSDSANPLFSVLGLGVMVFTSTLLFVAWKEVVDIIWGVPRRRGVKASLLRRLFGLAAVLGSGVVLTLTIVSQTLVAALGAIVPLDALDIVVRTVVSILPAATGTLFLAVLFKYTPDVDVEWRSAWLGAATAMLLLVVGGWGYGIYLEEFGLRSTAGFAGSLLLGLALVYYTAVILLYGIEIVKTQYLNDHPLDS